MTTKKVIILDFGSQYTQLIARRVRELKVYSEILPCFTPVNEVDLEGLEAVILSGGPASVLDDSRPEFDAKWLEQGVPVLGVCYGMQLIAKLMGGSVESSQKREYGHADITVLENNDLFNGFALKEGSKVWMSHGDHVETVPEGFQVLANSDSIPVAAMGNAQKNIYALQFHPEVVHSERGTEIISNFLFKISNCEADWDPSHFITAVTEQVRNQVHEGEKVICALSGGVDSAVAAVLLDRALPGQLKCIFVDNGVLRKDEAEQVATMMRELGLDLEVVDAKEKFLGRLREVTDPEEKRKIIGNTFIEVFDEKAKKISDVRYLVQGTLYPDVIESVSVRGPSAVIKSHHNVGGLPQKMNLKLIEPFKELFKDEVRAVGRELEVPETVINRQPFPGPGLAVRILGEVTKERIEVLQAADAIVTAEIKAAGLYESIWQSFAVLLPVNSVGVMGDSRTYEQCIALRAVYSQDGMTANWCYLPEEVLRKISNRIINEVQGVNRVVLDISSKPPATIEWE